MRGAIISSMRREESASSAELDDSAAVAFGRASCGQLFELAHSFALGCNFLAEFAAGVGLAVEGLGDGSGAAHFAEEENFDFEVTALVGDTQHVADADFARGFGSLAVGFDPAEFTGMCGKRACLEKSCRPQPLVDAHRGHKVLSSIFL
jgi:hypothetical protein